MSFLNSLLGRVKNTVNNDIVKPIQRDVVRPATTAARNTGGAIATRSSQIYDQANMLDNGRTYQQRKPVNTRSVIGQFTHNGTSNVAGGFAKGIAGMTGVPAIIDTTRLAAGELTHNQRAIDNATTNLARSLPQFLPIAAASGAKTALTPVAQAIAAPYANHVADQEAARVRHLFPQTGNKAYDASVEAYANAVKGDNLNSYLNRSGLDMNTSKADVAKRVAGQMYGGTAEAVLAGKMGIASTPAKVLAKIGVDKAAAGSAVKEGLKEWGPLGAISGAANTAANPDASNMDIIRAGVMGYGANAALPIALHSAGKTTQLVKDFGVPRPTSLSDAELAASQKVIKQQTGWGDQGITADDAGHFHNAQMKLGHEPGTPEAATAVHDALLQHQAYESAVAQRKQAATAMKQQMTVSGETGGAKAGDIIPNKLLKDAPTAAETPAMPTATQSRAVAPTTKLVAQPAVQDGSLANGTAKTAKFTTSVQHSPEASAEVRQAVGASYVPGNNAEVVGTAKDQIAQQGLEPILNQTLTELGGERGTASRDSLATAIELAKQHDALGTPEAQATAAHLYDLVAEHGSAKGQGAQILATIARNSPAGLRNKAFRDLKKAGVDVTPEIQKEIQGHINAISTMKDGPAKDMAIAVLQKAVSKHLPQSIGDRAISLWKAGLLSGVKTQQGNAISNGTFAGLKKVSDIPATAADKLMALKTGERTKTITFSGAGSGTKEGFKNAGTTLKTGIDPRNIGDKYEQHAEINFGSKILQNVLAKPANMIFRGMSAADQPFWYSALKNSLYDQAKADGINKGLRGKALLDHMNKTVANPTEKMADVATNEANKSTLNFDTVGSKAIQAVHKGIDNMPGITPAGKSVAHGVINVLAPFTKVPTAFITRTVDFTPLGITKEVFHQIAGKEFNQRALAQAIGEGLTGTGVIALGMTLANKGQLSGDYPKNDQKEQQRWKAEGITPNSVKVGGKWINMNYLGPVGLLFNAGHQLTTAKSESALNQVGATIGGLGQGLLGQSFLQGFTGFSDAMKDPARNGKSFVNSQASSVVPSIVNDVANVTDKFQRQADNVSQSIKNRVPGLRETNAPKQDVYGNTLKQAGGQLNTLNGLKPSNSLTNSNPVIAEVNRLHSVDPNNNDLQVTPTPVGKSITLPAATKGAKGATINLNDKQRYDLQKQVGQATQDNWGKLIKTPEYQAMSDADKAKKLTSMRQDATEFTTRKYVVDNNLGTYDKPAGSGAVALAKGDISKYTSSSSGASSTADYYKSPDAEYKSIQDSYNKKAKAGWNSQAEKIKADKQLASAKVGSKFDKAIRDAHALSNADLYDLVHNDKNGNDIVKKVLAYDDALTNAGVQSKNKFRNKYGNVTIGSASVAKSSGGKGGSKATGSKEATQFAAALAKKNSAAKSSQDALLNLVKNAHVSAPRAAGSKATVANVTLKKQSVKQNKVKAIA